MVQLKKRMTYACIFDSILYELSHWQEPNLVILFKVNKSLELSLHSIILTLCLLVGLRVERVKESSLDAKKIIE